MTMTVQEQKKKRRKRDELSPEQEDALAKGLGELLGADCKVKRPTKQLEAALDALTLDWNKLQAKVDTVFTIGRKEEYSDKEIGNMIRERMKEHYSKRTITNVFENYPDAKYARRGKFRAKSALTEDKYRFYKETIEAKNKLLREKDEEIEGLKKKIADLEDKIKRLNQ